MEEGLFEKAFREKKESLGMVDKPVVTTQNEKQLAKPIITKPQAQQPQIIINVNGGKQGYKQRPMRQAQRRRPRMKQQKQRPLLTKKEKEMLRKNAKTAGKAVGSGAKKAFGFLKKKTSGKKSPYGKKSWFNK